MGPQDSADISTGSELVSEHLSWRGVHLFKVLQSVHQEGGTAAQIELEVRLIF